jgi:glycosyltransferase involved in cell wall biosynthesis
VAHDKEDFIVLWASRYTRQKNIPLLRKIVAATPEIIYEVWGQGDSEVLLREAANEYKNLRVMGPYSSFNALPIGRYSAFLYTSLWDGIPNVLLEAASFGLPIVSSSVGGIRELIDERTGWLIESLDDARPYVASLREIRADKQAANDRCNRMFERLDTQHSWEQFVNVMETSGIVEVER